MAQKQSSSRMTLVVTIVIAVLLVVVIWPLSMIGKGNDEVSSDKYADEVFVRILPVARVELAKPAAAGADAQPRDGATVYNTVCMACHASGAAGAPKAGDKEAWAPRIASGTDALVASVVNGKGAMPPKGGGADLSNDEIRAAVEHLVGLSQ